MRPHFPGCEGDTPRGRRRAAEQFGAPQLHVASASPPPNSDPTKTVALLNKVSLEEGQGFEVFEGVHTRAMCGFERACREHPDSQLCQDHEPKMLSSNLTASLEA